MKSSENLSENIHHAAPGKSKFLRRLAVSLIFAFFLLLSISLISQPRGSVVVLSSLKIGPYQRIANSIRKKIGTDSAKVFYLDRDSQALSQLSKMNPRAIITVGSQALEKTLPLHGNTPLVFTMVLFHKDIVRTPRPSVRGIAMTCNPGNQLRILKHGFGFHRVTAFYNPAKTGDYVSLFKELNDSDIEVRAVEASSLLELQAKIPKALEDTSACMLVPDPTILTEEGIKSILNACYERNVPIVGFSPMYIDMGAALTISVSEEEIANQAARLVSGGREGQPVHDGLYFVKKPQVTINRSACNKFKIKIDRTYISSNAFVRWRER